jgi:hypothetical protein
MRATLKLSSVLMVFFVSFIFSAGDVRAEDPIVGCWDISGKIKATATIKGQSASQRSNF